MSASRIVGGDQTPPGAVRGKRDIISRRHFTAHRKRVFEFCDILIKEKVDITWMCLADANSITEEMAIRMKEAGCWHIGIGVESGIRDH